MGIRPPTTKPKDMVKRKRVRTAGRKRGQFTLFKDLGAHHMCAARGAVAPDEYV